MYSSDELFLRSFECYSGVFSLVASQLGEKKTHQNNPLASAETIRHSSTYIILYINELITGKDNDTHNAQIHMITVSIL